MNIRIATALGKEVSALTVPKDRILSPVPVPDWWISEVGMIERELQDRVTAGERKQLSESPGGRPVYAVYYGTPEPEWQGTANFNSALGAKNPDAYYKRSKRVRPVLCIIGGIHGHEVEGMVSALSVIRILEEGLDLSGVPQPELAAKLKSLRVIVVPLANPDGRARVPYLGWSGIPQDEMTRWGQGTRKNGDLYRWQPCKEVHPMKGDVGLLGGYFDDNGVNMMHDDWADPMSETTRSLMRLVAAEGPDCLINLHSYSSPPGVLPVAYIPEEQKRRINAFAIRLNRRISERGHAYAKLPDELNLKASPDEISQPALNLQSMFYHLGADLPILFESPHGVVSPTAAPFAYEAILDVHHQLFEQAADELLRI
jgi:hypothetical protein